MKRYRRKNRPRAGATTKHDPSIPDAIKLLEKDCYQHVADNPPLGQLRIARQTPRLRGKLRAVLVGNGHAGNRRPSWKVSPLA
jgi:hypothetical protein